VKLRGFHPAQGAGEGKFMFSICGGKAQNFFPRRRAQQEETERDRKKRIILNEFQGKVMSSTSCFYRGDLKERFWA